MELQQIFDVVKTHLKNQEMPSTYRSKNGCLGGAYRNSLGQKCAVGCLIPDEKYKPEIEELGIFELEPFYYNSRDEEYKSRLDYLREGLKLTIGDITASKIDLLSELQRKHDLLALRSSDSNYQSCLEEVLQQIADKFNLINS
jgi:hypothetical protein